MTDAPLAARRPRNAEATRAAILAAAKARFARDGYEQVGVRDIAADAGIDPAMVNRYFGSKEGLFTAVVNSITKEPLEQRISPPELGEQMARMILSPASERRHDQLMALDLAIRSTNSPTAHAIVRTDLEERFIAPLIARFGGGADATARAHIWVAINMGVGVLRGVLGEGAPSPQVREEMIAHLAPIFDMLADLDPGPGPRAGEGARGG